MKTVEQFKQLGAADRAKNLKSRVRKDEETKKEIVKILVAAEEAGDFGKGKGEMNAYAVKTTGCELRESVQGTYERCNVMRAIRAGTLVMTEAEFDSKTFGLYPLMRLGTLISSYPDKVVEALEIIRSKIDVTNRLRALTEKPKAEVDKSKDSEPKDKSKSAGGGDGDGGEPAMVVELPKGFSLFVPEGTAILSSPELLAAIRAEIEGAPSQESVENYLGLFLQFAGLAEARGNALAAAPAVVAKVA